MPKVIFLNGTSSSGKTPIAKEILKNIHGEYLSIDDFINKYSKILEFPKIVEKFHEEISLKSNLTTNIVVDTVLEKLTWYVACKEALKCSANEVIWVSVIAPLDVLEGRERNRHDRKVGLARNQYFIV